MKLHEFVQFKNKIEKKRNLFDLPSLPDSAWEYMLQRAKTMKEIEVTKTYSFFTLFTSFMCSKKMSFALSMAIIVALVVSLFNMEFMEEYNAFKEEGNSSHQTHRVNVPVINVSDNSFI